MLLSLLLILVYDSNNGSRVNSHDSGNGSGGSISNRSGSDGSSLLYSDESDCNHDFHKTFLKQAYSVDFSSKPKTILFN